MSLPGTISVAADAKEPDAIQRSRRKSVAIVCRTATAPAALRSSAHAGTSAFDLELVSKSVGAAFQAAL
jgi:hypothetical protein